MCFALVSSRGARFGSTQFSLHIAVPHSASQNVASACNHAVAEGVKGVVLLESRTGFLEGGWWEPVGRNVLRFAGVSEHLDRRPPHWMRDDS